MFILQSRPARFGHRAEDPEPAAPAAEAKEPESAQVPGPVGEPEQRQVPETEPEPNQGGQPDEPLVLHVATLSKSEKDKLRRIVTPKSTTGRLEVPQDIFDMWKTQQGKEKLFAMWCKSGGVKDKSS